MTLAQQVDGFCEIVREHQGSAEEKKWRGKFAASTPRQQAKFFSLLIKRLEEDQSNCVGE